MTRLPVRERTYGYSMEILIQNISHVIGGMYLGIPAAQQEGPTGATNAVHLKRSCSVAQKRILADAKLTMPFVPHVFCCLHRQTSSRLC